MNHDDITLRAARAALKLQQNQSAFISYNEVFETAKAIIKHAIDEATAEYKEALRIAWECHQSTANRYAVKLEGLQKQLAAQGDAEPVATLHDDGHWTHPPGRDPLDQFSGKRRMEVYAAPPAKPHGERVLLERYRVMGNWHAVTGDMPPRTEWGPYEYRFATLDSEEA